MSNREFIQKALRLLTIGLHPFVETQFLKAYGDNWWNKLMDELPPYKLPPISRDGKRYADAQWLLLMVWDYWDSVFSKTLGNKEQEIVRRLRDVRRDWAHEVPFDDEYTVYVFECVMELLKSVSSPKYADILALKGDYEGKPPTLRQVREKCGLSRRELAKRTEVAYATIWRIEHNKHIPHMITRRQLARVLKTKPHQITWPSQGEEEA